LVIPPCRTSCIGLFPSQHHSRVPPQLSGPRRRRGQISSEIVTAVARQALAMEDPSLYEKIADIWEKLGIAFTVVTNSLPGGRFALGTQKVRGIDTRVFTSLPPTFSDYWRPWLKMWGPKKWLSYEGESFTFAEVSNSVPHEYSFCMLTRPQSGSVVGPLPSKIPKRCSGKCHCA